MLLELKGVAKRYQCGETVEFTEEVRFAVPAIDFSRVPLLA